MASSDYHARYFRPQNSLRVYFLLRVYCVSDGASVHDGLSKLCEIVEHTPCEREVYRLGCVGRSSERPCEYYVCCWTPSGGISDIVNVQLGSRIVSRLEVIPSEIYSRLCERAAVLAVLSNLGVDVNDTGCCGLIADVKAYLAHH